MWRLVEDGEIIQSGDEIYSSIKDEDWVECPTSVGETFSLEIMYPVRRKINTAESQNSTSTNTAMFQLLSELDQLIVHDTFTDTQKVYKINRIVNEKIAQQQHS